jgi:hypothetical protein
MQATREDVDGATIGIVARVEDGLIDRRNIDEVVQLAPVVKVADDF